MRHHGTRKNLGLKTNSSDEQIVPDASEIRMRRIEYEV